MSATTLEEVQCLVDRLSPLDQVRLLEYLVPRLARAVAAAQAAEPAPSDANSEAWQRLFRIGDQIADSAKPGPQTLTQALISMRR
jgi:hypothetical protein